MAFDGSDFQPQGGPGKRSRPEPSFSAGREAGGLLLSVAVSICLSVAVSYIVSDYDAAGIPRIGQCRPPRIWMLGQDFGVVTSLVTMGVMLQAKMRRIGLIA